jgi:hypothetical protein
VPAEDSFGLNDRECIENAWCDPIEQHEDQPIAYVKPSPFRWASTQHIELLAQGQHLRLERGSRSEQIEERRGDQADEVAHPAFIARFGASRQADGISDRDTRRRDCQFVKVTTEGEVFFHGHSGARSGRRFYLAGNTLEDFATEIALHF